MWLFLRPMASIKGFFPRDILRSLSLAGMKLPAHRVGLPGHAVASRMRANEISFFIVPLGEISSGASAWPVATFRDGMGVHPIPQNGGFRREIMIFLPNLHSADDMIC